MKPLTPEWVECAEDSWNAFHRLAEDTAHNHYDYRCYYAHRSIEMYFKAVLQQASVRFQKTHDLCILLDMALPLMPSLDGFRAKLETLADYDYKFRYPGYAATRENAEDAQQICAEIRAVIRPALGLGG